MGTKAKGTISTERSKDEIFRILLVLERNNMNQSVTSRELGIHRTVLIRYYKRYWDEYIMHRKYVKQDAATISEEKKEILLEMESFKQGLGELQMLAVDRMKLLLKGKKNFTPKMLLEIIREISPYLVEKQGLTGVKDVTPDPFSQYTIFVQNIMQKMNIYKNENSNNSNQRNKPIGSVTIN